MLSPGPLFHVELRAAARRRRDHIVRVVYGLGLLVILPVHNLKSPYRVMSIYEVAEEWRSAFPGFAWVQWLAVLILTPAVVAGAIAGERHRRTLIELLSSPLTAAEIVLGKLLTRLVRLISVLAVGLPIMIALSFLGGIDPGQVVGAFTIALGTVIALAGLAMVASTLARRSRDAILAAYLLAALWLLATWALAADPIAALIAIADGSPPAGATFAELIVWFLLIQAIVGAVGVLAAVGLLRRVGRLDGSRAARRRWPRLRFGPRPAIGDDPMAWKEQYANRNGGWVRGLIVLAGLLAVVGAGFEAIRLAIPAFGEVSSHGYGGNGPSTHARGELSGYIRPAGVFLYGLWALGIATSAAVGLAEEREAGTWSSLLVTDLNGDEIIQAKARGAIRSMRGLGIALMTLWTLGLAAGALHPFGFVLVMLGFNAFGRAIAALGTLISLRAATSTRALTWTVVSLLAANLAGLTCCAGSPLLLAFCTPALIGVLPLSYADVAALLGRGDPGGTIFGGTFGGELLLTCFLGIGYHAFLSYILRLFALASFDDAVGRPRRLSDIPIDL